MPPTLGQIIHLSYLHLNNSKLSGPIPPEWISLTFNTSQCALSGSACTENNCIIGDSFCVLPPATAFPSCKGSTSICHVNNTLSPNRNSVNTEHTENNTTRLSAPEIVGISIGCVVAFLFLILVFLWFRKRRSCEISEMGADGAAPETGNSKERDSIFILSRNVSDIGFISLPGFINHSNYNVLDSIIPLINGKKREASVFHRRRETNATLVNAIPEYIPENIPSFSYPSQLPSFDNESCDEKNSSEKTKQVTFISN